MGKPNSDQLVLLDETRREHATVESMNYEGNNRKHLLERHDDQSSSCKKPRLHEMSDINLGRTEDSSTLSSDTALVHSPRHDQLESTYIDVGCQSQIERIPTRLQSDNDNQWEPRNGCCWDEDRKLFVFYIDIN